MIFSEELENLLKTKIKCIWINTYEEEKVMLEIKNIIASKFPNMKLNTWSFLLGLKEEKLNKSIPDPKDYKNMPPDVVLKTIFKEQFEEDSSALWIFKDGHMLSDIKPFIRGVRDLKEISKTNSYNPIIIISPLTDIPIEQEKLWTVLNYELPTEEELFKLSQSAIRAMQLKNSKGISIPNDEELRRCAKLAVGLTLNQAKEYIAKSIKLFGTIKEDMFFQARIDLINKTGVLEYSDCKMNLEDMGGNSNFKNWILDIKETFSKEAEDFGVEKSKGFLALGIPGQLNVV